MSDEQTTAERLEQFESFNPRHMGSVIEKLGMYIQTLENQVDATEMFFKETQDEVKEALKQVEELEKDLAARPKNENMRRLIKARDELAAELVAANAGIAVLKDENMRLGAIDNKRTKIIDGLNTDIVVFREKLEKSREIRDEKTRDISKLKSENFDLRMKIEELEMTRPEVDSIKLTMTEDELRKKRDYYFNLCVEKDRRINELEDQVKELGAKTEIKGPEESEDPQKEGESLSADIHHPEQPGTYYVRPSAPGVMMVCRECGSWGGQRTDNIPADFKSFGQCLHNAHLKEGFENETRGDYSCPHWSHPDETKLENRKKFYSHKRRKPKAKIKSNAEAVPGEDNVSPTKS